MNIVIPYSAPVPSHRKQHACDCLLKAIILQQRKSLFFRERARTKDEMFRICQERHGHEAITYTMTIHTHYYTG